MTCLRIKVDETYISTYVSSNHIVPEIKSEDLRPDFYLL